MDQLRPIKKNYILILILYLRFHGKNKFPANCLLGEETKLAKVAALFKMTNIIIVGSSCLDDTPHSQGDQNDEIYGDKRL